MTISRTIMLLGALCASMAALGEAQAATCTAPACTKVIDNGPDAGKKVVVIMGDGFASGDQTSYNTNVLNLVTQGMFGNDFFAEEQNAFNVYRINLTSVDSGMSKITYDENGTSSDGSDDTVVSIADKNTPLRYRFSGSWAHCWLEHTWSGGIDLTESAKNAALANNGLSHADYVIVLLNDPAYGGCNRGPRDIVQPLGISWQVVAHEAGHGIGGLRDEYSAGRGAYSGSLVNTMNCSSVLDRSSVVWNRFIDPATPVVTSLLAGMDSNRTVGEFTGCSTYDSGIYRPVHNCRMKGNTPNYCPVCQTLMRKQLYPNLEHTFDTALTGDFDGDGRDDVLIHNGGDLAIYRTSTSPYQSNRVWTANNMVPAMPGGSYTWTLRPGDRYSVGDFDGDGKDDVYVINTTDWYTPYIGLLRSNGTGLEAVLWYGTSVPGYGNIGTADQLFVADFDADGKKDLYLFTGSSSSTVSLGLLHSTGTGLTTTIRYDGAVPGWSMRAGDKLYVADFDGDNREDLYVFNGVNWAYKYLGMLRSSGTGISDIKLYTTTLASGWNMGANDQHFVADIDADGKDDLYVFNGTDWSVAYLELTHSSGTTLDYAARYDDDSATAWATNIPGWTMKKGDRFFVSDANKDGRGDLFVYNTTDWNTQYLGTLMSGGTTLSGSWSADWVGSWNLGVSDQFLSANYEGGAGKADLFVRNTEWFGLIRRTSSGFTMDRHYYHWIYTPLYDSKPWSDSMP
ncbi:M64 family metallopeptidase [Vitiosangium sp. GDMCC 1.1324]|uniref:FG-GAP-like repeat-containing protein n=1 Tax=Vitiosangium sp. (strain GDMCC 1.1324) TaxID=2138576 RepID=UPI00130E1373|nr:M64 family metallopeptidase [Vitiosangium sp. GDMCC 1.1324]